MGTDDMNRDALDDEAQTEKDTSYSPASEAETAASQRDGGRPANADEVDADAVRVAPGTGGPDDAGDINVDAGDINEEAIRRDRPTR